MSIPLSKEQKDQVYLTTMGFFSDSTLSFSTLVKPKLQQLIDDSTQIAITPKVLRNSLKGYFFAKNFRPSVTPGSKRPKKTSLEYVGEHIELVLLCAYLVILSTCGPRRGTFAEDDINIFRIRCQARFPRFFDQTFEGEEEILLTMWNRMKFIQEFVGPDGLGKKITIDLAGRWSSCQRRLVCGGTSSAFVLRCEIMYEIWFDEPLARHYQSTKHGKAPLTPEEKHANRVTKLDAFLLPQSPQARHPANSVVLTPAQIQWLSSSDIATTPYPTAAALPTHNEEEVRELHTHLGNNPADYHYMQSWASDAVDDGVVDSVFDFFATEVEAEEEHPAKRVRTNNTTPLSHMFVPMPPVPVPGLQVLLPEEGLDDETISILEEYYSSDYSQTEDENESSP